MILLFIHTICGNCLRKNGVLDYDLSKYLGFFRYVMMRHCRRELYINFYHCDQILRVDVQECIPLMRTLHAIKVALSLKQSVHGEGYSHLFLLKTCATRQNSVSQTETEGCPTFPLCAVSNGFKGRC